MVDFKKEEQPSVFNPALAYVQSLAKLMDMLDGMFLIQDYPKVYLILTRIYNRIKHKLKEKEINPINELRNGIIPLINKITKDNFGELGEKLEKLDEELKVNMNRYGLLMPSKEDPRFAVLRR